MKHKTILKHLLSVCLCTALMLICMLGLTVNAQAAEITASGTCGNNLTWTLDSEGTLTISGTGAMTDYSEYGAPWYSSRSSVKKVVLEDGVTSIGDNAFYKCTSLTGVYISDIAAWCNISFGNTYANPLYYAKTLYLNGEIVTHLVIPDSVTSIGYLAFSYCSSLTSVTIPDSVTSIGEDAFYGCSSLTSVTLGNGVTNIGSYAFYGCDLTSVIIPHSVTTIGSIAFMGCDINVSENNSNYSSVSGVLFNKDKTELIQVPSTISGSFTIPDSVTCIDNYAFYNCSSLTSVTIPDSVTSIGGSAFHYCSSLTSVTIPDSVTGIGNYAFYGCSSLTSVTIGDSVTSIGNFAFYDCSSLTSVTIGDSVTSIGYSAFEYCDNLQYNIYDNAKYLGNADNPYAALIESTSEEITSCNIHENTKVIAGGAFSSCRNLSLITIPDSVSIIGVSTFANCNSLISISIPDTVTTICDSAFSNCNSLTSITIPDSVTSIGGKAFYKCTSLTSVTIPDSVTTIGQDAFSFCQNLTDVHISDIATWCNISFDGALANPLVYNASLYLDGEKLTELVIPDGVLSIHDYAFFRCASITSVTIPDSVTAIWNRAFYECNNLTSVIIGNNVTTIGYEAFYYCDNLTSVTIADSVAIIDEYAFGSCYSLNDIYISDITAWCNITFGNRNANPLYYGESLYLNGKEITDLVIPDGVTVIPNYAFKGCKKMTSVTIPDNVTSIGDWAFSHCTSLTSVTIPDSVTSIGDFAFENCSDLEIIAFTGNAPKIGDNALDGVIATAYYPVNNDTWTADTMQHYSGQITWTSYGGMNIDSGTCGDDLTWTLDSDGTLTISGTGAMTDYYGASPSPWEYNQTITKIVIEEGVTGISEAFTFCSNLTAVVLPNSMITIDPDAFDYCDNLQYNTFDNAKYLGNEQNPYLYLVESINDDITDCTIYEGTRIIASYAFKDCQKLTTLNVPDSIIYVGYGAFDNCSSLQYHLYDNAMYLGNTENPYVILIKSTTDTITECEISLNAKVIYTSAFQWCAELTEVVIPDTVTQIAYDAFSSCIVLESITLPENALAIDDEAFYNCEKLPEVTFPENVKTIGYGVFDQCSYLKKLYFNGDAPHFDDEAFFGLSAKAYYPANNDTWTEGKLQDYGGYIQWNSILSYGTCGDNLLWELNGEGVLAISGTGAMSDFSYNAPWRIIYDNDIKTVEISEGVTTVGDTAFIYCNNITSVSLPSSLTSIGRSAFEYCSGLISINIPDSVTTISDYAFRGCGSLEAVTIPDDLTHIGTWAFIECSNLTAINVNSNNPSYYSCSSGALYDKVTDELIRVPGGITGSFVIPNGTKSIKESAFKYCCVSSVIIPDSVTSIGSNAFYYCDLESIVIPESVTTIGSCAFAFCSYLSDISIPEQADIGDLVFLQCRNLKYNTYQNIDYIGNEKNPYVILMRTTSSDITSCEIPDGVTRIESSAFEGCYKLTSVSIPNSVRSIGSYAFYGCSRLASVTIPNNVTNIDYEAFSNCGSLSEIYFKGDVPSVDVSTFCNVIATAYYPDNNSTWSEDKLQNYGGTITWVSYTPAQFEITAQPTSKTVKDGATAKLTVTATGNGLTYQWQYRTSSSGSWKNASATGNKTKTLSVAATVAKHGYQYRCKITDSAGNVVYTDVVDLYVLGIKTQPVNKTVKAGATAKLTVSAVGDGLTYQWQYRTSSSGSWKNASATGNKTKTLSVAATIAKHGYQYRCKITDSAGNVIYTNVVDLYVLGIKTQPASKTVKAGATAKLTVSAVGDGLTYQWQYRTSSSGSWKNASATGNKTKTLSVAATVAKHGYQYRCKVTDTAGNTVYTSVVTLNVLGIKTQPASKTVKAGATAKFTVTAVGNGLTYQWQYRTSSSGSWKNASATGNKTKTLSVAATIAKHGYQYRCKVTDTAGNTVYTSVVNLYVLGIKTQPVNKTVKAGATAKFTVKATGKGLTYQWQYRTSSSGSWKNVSVASGKTANYSLTAAARHNGYQYRCKITDSAGNVIYTSIVKLTVK